MICNKVKYSTVDFALQDIKRISKSSTRENIPVRTYFCIKCGAYHLTSKEDLNAYYSLVNALKEENERLLNEIKLLKNKSNKEDNLAIKKDDRVKILNKTIINKDALIKRIRKDNEELIIRMNQLTKK